MMHIWNHIRAVLLLPFMVAVVVPGVLLCMFGLDTWHLWQSAPVTRIALPLIGALLVLLGLTLLVATIRLFVTIGKGTLAPWDPTQKFVVQGIYRHARNPMISGVFFILLGEAVATASLALLIWAAVFIAGNMIYMPLVEEPGLGELSMVLGSRWEKRRSSTPRFQRERFACGLAARGRQLWNN